MKQNAKIGACFSVGTADRFALLLGFIAHFAVLSFSPLQHHGIPHGMALGCHYRGNFYHLYCIAQEFAGQENGRAKYSCMFVLLSGVKGDFWDCLRDMGGFLLRPGWGKELMIPTCSEWRPRKFGVSNVWISGRMLRPELTPASSTKKFELVLCCVV